MFPLCRLFPVARSKLLAEFRRLGREGPAVEALLALRGSFLFRRKFHFALKINLEAWSISCISKVFCFANGPILPAACVVLNLCQ